MAAVLACGDRAVLSHSDGAALWGMRATSAARVHVTVPTSAGLSQRRGIALHRSRDLRSVEVAHRDGIPVTAPARTLLDLAGMVAPGALERAVEEALVLRLFHLGALRAVLAAHPTRSGAAALAAIIASVHDEPSLTRSEAEALFLDLCAKHAIERPAVNARIEDLTVDFAWQAQRVVVEIDGHRYHGTRTAFERDRARDARLTLAGYRVVRFTYRRLIREPAAVASVVIGLLARPRYAASSSSSSPERSAAAVSL
jgi:very-short-patch-repair endonuclease